MLNFAHFVVNDVILAEMLAITYKKQNLRQRSPMGRLIKFLIYLICLSFIGLVGYAYIGPFFGADFSAPQSEIREPVDLNAD